MAHSVFVTKGLYGQTPRVQQRIPKRPLRPAEKSIVLHERSGGHRIGLDAQLLVDPSQRARVCQARIAGRRGGQITGVPVDTRDLLKSERAVELSQEGHPWGCSPTTPRNCTPCVLT